MTTRPRRCWTPMPYKAMDGRRRVAGRSAPTRSSGLCYPTHYRHIIRGVMDDPRCLLTRNSVWSEKGLQQGRELQPALRKRHMAVEALAGVILPGQADANSGKPAGSPPSNSHTLAPLSRSGQARSETEHAGCTCIVSLRRNGKWAHPRFASRCHVGWRCRPCAWWWDHGGVKSCLLALIAFCQFRPLS